MEWTYLMTNCIAALVRIRFMPSWASDWLIPRVVGVELTILKAVSPRGSNYADGLQQ